MFAINIEPLAHVTPEICKKDRQLSWLLSFLVLALDLEVLE
jgi:hypothetical protein